jgi:hypothetical protein
MEDSEKSDILTDLIDVEKGISGGDISNGDRVCRPKPEPYHGTILLKQTAKGSSS